MIFLNQIILTKGDGELSAKLIAVYFDLFKLILRTHANSTGTEFGKSTVNTRMLSALLSGVNRAFPFSSQGKETSVALSFPLFPDSPNSKISHFISCIDFFSVLKRI